MLQVVHIAPTDQNFLIEYSDGSVSLLSAEELASRLKGNTEPSLDIVLETAQIEAIAALTRGSGQTIDDFIEMAIIEKMLRDQ